VLCFERSKEKKYVYNVDVTFYKAFVSVSKPLWAYNVEVYDRVS